MTYLLDTHLLLWWLADDPALPKDARHLIQEAASLIFVSAASAWEIAIKKAMGKLQAPDDLEAALTINRFQPLPIHLRHALLAGQLPRHHEDPFDRMLIAQAQIESFTLLTHDSRLKRYGHFVQIVH